MSPWESRVHLVVSPRSPYDFPSSFHAQEPSKFDHKMTMGWSCDVRVDALKSLLNKLEKLGKNSFYKYNKNCWY